MIPSPTHVLYTCIARSTTVLAEFTRDSDLMALGKQCVESTPNFHSIFSHTFRSRTYAFVIDRPFVYFGIFDEALGKPECIAFLNWARESFLGLIKGGLVIDSENLSRYSLQREFDTMVEEYFRSSSVSESPSMATVETRNPIPSLELDKVGRTFVAPSVGSPLSGLKKKKKRCNGEYGLTNGDANTHRDGNVVNRVEVCDEVSCHVTFSNSGSRDVGVCVLKSVGDGQRAKQAWKRHVWAVLLLDLVFCVILFAVWLWVCGGFQCIKG